MKRRSTAALAALAGIVLLLTGCKGGYAEGPAGRVVSHQNTYDSATKTRAYGLTTQNSAGLRTAFRVHITDYDDCPDGADYPACAH
ncbi:hypothetical protein QFZ66_008546 [Streptomyces sp. B4I13]|uniref:hypothetical protein n=1 Tax=Streptomyces sp. B4I13 TaxID=3042271 RepID=UPI00278153F6|nr:hypothetical protein [Streptomyces sp. B4I13]MDQ0964578.1 hypothetical protein [Streptomyces sp. B4I13]